MKPSKTNHQQGRLFEQRLSDLLNPHHELCWLAGLLKWDILEKEFEGLFEAEAGTPAKPTRLMIGLMLLQHMYHHSDESVVERWVENPYWQLFCGYDYLQWQFPIHPTTLTKWRQRMGVNGLEKLLSVMISTARSVGAVKESSLKKIIVDTTVAPKAVTYPTDAKLYLKSLKQLVQFAKQEKLPLRQTYERLGPRVLRRANQLFHAKKTRKALKEVKRLKVYCGRVFREVLRALEKDHLLQKRAKPVLFVIAQILLQDQEGYEKVYSLHEPQVECIAKGKAHKKYEFGCKVSIAITHREGFVVGAQALHGRPFDGHTLSGAIEQIEELSGIKLMQVFVDKGYRGHDVTNCNVLISGSKRKLKYREKQDMKRRQSIEPHIGHMKADGKLGRNFLKGVLGDMMHALLCGIGHNMRFMCNFFRAQPSPA